MFGFNAFSTYPFATVKSVLGTYRSLAGNTGAYVVTGKSASLAYLSNYSLACAGGSYAITGKGALLHLSKAVTAGTGTYSIYGNSATFRIDHKLTCVNGTYVITGKSATIIYNNRYSLICTKGTYAVTGQDSKLTLAKKLTLNNGAYTVTGQDSVLLYQLGISFDFITTNAPELTLKATDNYDMMLVSNANFSDLTMVTINGNV